MKMSNDAQWITAALAYSKIGQSELARRVDEKLNRLHDRSKINKTLLNKRKLTVDELFAIEEITGFPVPTEAHPSVVWVPLLDYVTAGKLADPVSQIPAEDVSRLAFADLGRGEFFALRVEGDSMDRLVPEGSTLVVNRADRTLVPEKAYVFMCRGETTFKLWRLDPPQLAPHSWNGSHRPLILKGKRHLEVIGRVRRAVLDL